MKLQAAARARSPGIPHDKLFHDYFPCHNANVVVMYVPGIKTKMHSGIFCSSMNNDVMALYLEWLECTNLFVPRPQCEDAQKVEGELHD